jgi:small subunit ribosomal protein S17e
MRLQCLNQISDWKERDMGKVRPEHVKRLARKLVERFPDKFTTEFEHNKKMVDTFTNISSTKFRNRVAGYTIQLVHERIPKNVEEII